MFYYLQLFSYVIVNFESYVMLCQNYNVTWIFDPQLKLPSYLSSCLFIWHLGQIN